MCSSVPVEQIRSFTTTNGRVRSVCAACGCGTGSAINVYVRQARGVYLTIELAMRCGPSMAMPWFTMVDCIKVRQWLAGSNWPASHVAKFRYPTAGSVMATFRLLHIATTCWSVMDIMKRTTICLTTGVG